MPTVHNSELVTHTVLVGSQQSLTAADELPHVLNVVDIEVESSLNKIPIATLTIADGNPYEQDFEVSNSGLLAPGKFVEVRLGYGGDNITVFKGIITANGHQIQDSQSRSEEHTSELQSLLRISSAVFCLKKKTN